MSDWIKDYLGKPWLVGADGPDAFDCWGLLADIYQKQKGIALPRYTELDKLKRSDVVSQIKVSIDEQWELLLKPVHLCAVGLSSLPNKIFHVGCFVETEKASYVIHTQQNFGCIIEPLSKIILNWRHITFYGLR